MLKEARLLKELIMIGENPTLPIKGLLKKEPDRDTSYIEKDLFPVSPNENEMDLKLVLFTEKEITPSEERKNVYGNTPERMLRRECLL